MKFGLFLINYVIVFTMQLPNFLYLSSRKSSGRTTQAQTVEKKGKKLRKNSDRWINRYFHSLATSFSCLFLWLFSHCFCLPHRIRFISLSSSRFSAVLASQQHDKTSKRGKESIGFVSASASFILTFLYNFVLVRVSDALNGARTLVRMCKCAPYEMYT